MECKLREAWVGGERPDEGEACDRGARDAAFRRGGAGSGL